MAPSTFHDPLARLPLPVLVVAAALGGAALLALTVAAVTGVALVRMTALAAHETVSGRSRTHH